MSKNSLELEFSGEEHGEGISSQHEHLRMSSFIVLALEKADKIDIIKSIEGFKYQIKEISPQTKIINMSSPFGLNAKELFLNIRFKGMIANKVSENLFLTDLDGHLFNVEGSPVFAKSSG